MGRIELPESGRDIRVVANLAAGDHEDDGGEESLEPPEPALVFVHDALDLCLHASTAVTEDPAVDVSMCWIQKANWTHYR